MFDHFDKDKTGQIDASEMDAVLLKLGVKLSKDAFEKMLKDADMDSKIKMDHFLLKKISDLFFFI